ncbi:hypothetical protein [Reichenbachiella sp.]|uniref:hypothetical protein n=1 Tax=Reichenbachiella sp. TaxID=2184521 RepID=UPI003B58BB00
MHYFTSSQNLELAKIIEQENPKELMVSKKLIQPHPLIKEAQTYYRVNNKVKRWQGNTVDLGEQNLSIHVTKPVLSRAIILFDALIKLAIVRKHKVYMDGTKTIISIQNIPMNIHLREKNKANYDNADRYNSRTLEPTGILCINLYSYYTEKEWYDAKTIKLESKLATIMAFLELKSDEEVQSNIRREEQARIREEEIKQKQDQARLIEQEQKKYQDLLNRADRWDLHQKVIKYISMIEQQKLESPAWIDWAKRKAEWLDPRSDKQDQVLGAFNNSNE